MLAVCARAWSFANRFHERTRFYVCLHRCGFYSKRFLSANQVLQHLEQQTRGLEIVASTLKEDARRLDILERRP
jgi:hypothetical protein